MTRGRPSCGYAQNEAAEAKQKAKFFCYSLLNDRLKPCPMQAVDGASWSVASVANGCQASVIETHARTHKETHTRPVHRFGLSENLRSGPALCV